MATIADQQWISIRNIIIYLETKFPPNRRIFVFWWPFWIQNGHHSKPKWSPYGAKNPPIWEKFGFQVDFLLAN
jgi:hypothetical protein